MLQRIQSIWLLLAAIFTFLTFRLPFYVGSHSTLPGLVDLNAKTTIWLTIVAAITGALAFITIFMFNNRKLQTRLCVFGILLSLGYLALCFLEMTKFLAGTVSISCFFYFAIPALYIFAFSGIRKDERLVKSMDRLR